MSKGSEAVKQWRRNTKERMITAMGGCCAICQYSKSSSALEFHHLDPLGKEFGMGGIRADPKSWATIVEELRKCVMLCSNCHREVHEGITDVPDDVPRFNEDYADYKGLARSARQTPCPVCAKPKPSHQKTCSRSCAGRHSGSVAWDSFDLPTMIATMAITDIADVAGCSSSSVIKRLKKIGLR